MPARPALACDDLDASRLETMKPPPFAIDDAGFARALAERPGG